MQEPSAQDRPPAAFVGDADGAGEGTTVGRAVVVGGVVGAGDMTLFPFL